MSSFIFLVRVDAEKKKWNERHHKEYQRISVPYFLTYQILTKKPQKNMSIILCMMYYQKHKWVSSKMWPDKKKLVPWVAPLLLKYDDKRKKNEKKFFFRWQSTVY